jgi:hypothetical protein
MESSMVKTDYLPLVRIEIEGKRAKIGFAETLATATAKDWQWRRTAAFDELRKKTRIPDTLISLVENLKERTPVSVTYNYYGESPLHPAGVFEMCVKVDNTEAMSVDLADVLAKIEAAEERLKKYDEDKQWVASEALAFLLRMYLRNLKYREQTSPAKARAANLLPRSTIAQIALDLLQSSCNWNYPAGDELVALFWELLNLENSRQGQPRKLEAQEKAAWLLANDPSLGTSELAKEVGTNKSSVSRWMRRPGFQAKVKAIRDRTTKEAK